MKPTGNSLELLVAVLILISVGLVIRQSRLKRKS